MQKWALEYLDGIRKCIKKLGGKELKQFKSKVIDLEFSENPKRLGELKGTRKHGYCYVINITASYRLAYRVNENQHTITLITVGDHKEVYGWDKKS